MTEREPGPVVWIGVHDLGRTGAPIVLLRYLRSLSPERRALVHVVALRGGPLATDLVRCCASLTTIQPADRRSLPGAAAVGLEVVGAGSAGRFLRRAEWSLRLARLPSPDVLLLHGAGAWPLSGAVPGSVPVVVHLHELTTGLDRSIPPDAQAAALGSARRVMVVSRQVADLALARGASSPAVEVVPGVVDDPPGAEVGPPTGPGPQRWVMGAGTPGWRKGTDRLAALAHPLGRSHPEVTVGWVGGRPSGADAVAVAAPDPVRWFDPTPDPWSVLRRAEVVVVPSREDPLPLVALEAGIRARPVVGLPSGGLVDLLAEGRGWVGARHDVAWLVDTVRSLLDRPQEAAEAGRLLRARVMADHLPGPVADRWWEILVDAAGG